MAEQITICKFILPLSWLYGLGVWIRNKLFDWRIFSSEEFPVPVISVGNISVGGTGKTPHTEYLIRLLKKNKNAKVAVLSRGYKRQSSGFVLADKNANSRTIGDEPFQMYRKFPEILVAVDTNRRRGITRLLALPTEKRPTIILLDDAYQHRHVKPSLNILLVNSNQLIYEDALLPAGRLREPAKNKSRANIVIVTKCPDSFKPIDYRMISKNLDLFPYQSLFFTSFKYGNLLSLFHAEIKPEISLAELKTKKISVLIVAGIASPQPIIDELKKYTPELKTCLYSDHHNFSKDELSEIHLHFKQLTGKSKIIVTTEKDAARLIDCQYLDKSIREALHYLPIEVKFNLEQEDLFKQKIEEHVKNVARNSILA